MCIRDRYTFALVLLRHFPVRHFLVRHFSVRHFPVLQIPVTRSVMQFPTSLPQLTGEIRRRSVLFRPATLALRARRVNGDARGGRYSDVVL